MPEPHGPTEYLRALLDSAHDAIIVVDHQRVITDCNRAFLEAFGLRRDQALGASTRILHADEETYQRFGDLVYPLLARQGRWRGEWTYQTRDGRELEMETVLTPLTVPGAAGFVGLMRDITSRLRAERSLRRSERLLSSIYRAAPVGIGVTRPHRILDWCNPRLASMTGYSADEMAGMPARRLYPSEEEYERVGQIKHSAVAKYGVGSVETRWQRKDGEIIEVMLSSAPLDPDDPGAGMVFTALDQTAAKSTQRAQQTFFDISSELMCVTDLRGNLLQVNPAMLRLLGYTREELLATPYLDFTHPEDREATSLAAETTRGGQKIVTFDNRWRCRDGSYRWMSWSSVPVLEDGLVYAVARDITEQKEAEETRSRLEGQLRQSQKMEALGTLAGGIAHDFNNILGAIIGYTEIAQGKTGSGEEAGRELSQILHFAGRARDLVRLILAFSRKVETSFGPMDLNRAVTNAVRILERTLPKMIHIRLDLAPDLPTTQGDMAQLEQVLVNLGTNARDAMGEVGELIIQTEHRHLDAEYCRDEVGLVPGEYAVLRVSDTGSGIDSEVMKRIFDPFFTTKGVGQGTGLGLSMVYGIIKNHGGSIACYSEPGRGTTFRIHLPVGGRTSAGDKARDESPVQVTGGRETVLLVDDEAAIREISRHTLEELGYRVLTASSGEAAMETWREAQGRIDLVVLDVGMPGMGGNRCLEEILGLDPEAKVIIASGYAPDTELKRVVARGAVGYLAKPFSLMEMAKAVRRALDQPRPPR